MLVDDTIPYKLTILPNSKEPTNNKHMRISKYKALYSSQIHPLLYLSPSKNFQNSVFAH